MDYTLIDAVTNEEMPRTRATDALVKQLMLDQRLDPARAWGPLPIPDNVGTDNIEVFLFINCPSCL